MNEILKMLNSLTADELDAVLVRGALLLEKKREDEARAALLEQMRKREEQLAQEKRRQEEIAQLQRRLQELQSQTPPAPEPVKGDGFVMREVTPPQPAPKPPERPAAPPAKAKKTCPWCLTENDGDTVFCLQCGKRVTPPQPAPKPPERPAAPPAAPAKKPCPYCQTLNDGDTVFCVSCGQRMDRSAPVRPAPPAQPLRPATPPPAQPRPENQVKEAPEGTKKWEMRPGEKMLYNRQEATLLEPVKSGKMKYYMEVTNQRILFSRESAASAATGVAFGLIGDLVKTAAGGGPKPWLEIPLAAVRSCGPADKKEFHIVADKTYVLKNHKYEKFLPDLVADAKR